MLEGGEDPLFSPGGWCAWRPRTSARPIRSAADANAAKDTTTSWARPRASWRWPQAVRPPGDGAQVERGYNAYREAKAGGQGKRPADAAHTHPECADEADEGLRTTARATPTTTTSRKGFSGQDYFPREDGPPYLLRPARARFEREIRKRLRLLGEDQARAGRRLIVDAGCCLFSKEETSPWGIPASLLFHALLDSGAAAFLRRRSLMQVPDPGIAVDIPTPRQFHAAVDLKPLPVVPSQPVPQHRRKTPALAQRG